MNKTMNLFKYYLVSEVLKALGLGIVFFIFPTSLIFMIGMNTMYLVLPSYQTVIGTMWLLNNIVLGFSIKIIYVTLKNYKYNQEVNYQLYSMILFGLGFIVISTVYAVILLFF